MPKTQHHTLLEMEKDLSALFKELNSDENLDNIKIKKYEVLEKIGRLWFEIKQYHELVVKQRKLKFRMTQLEKGKVK